MVYLFEKEISVYRFKIHISVYTWKEEGRKRIILVDYLLQIYFSCLCRYRPPISFMTLQLFFFSWNPMFDFESSESLFGLQIC